MAPFREFTNWDIRSSDLKNEIEPYKKYYFLCEGENTERWYFESLINDRAALKLHPLIDVRHLEKTGSDSHSSSPKKLLEFANQLKNELPDFDTSCDKIIIVFDADIYANKYDELQRLINEMENCGHIVALTNPSFELFLLLHIKNSYTDIIQPNEQAIIQNKKTGKKRFIAKLFSDTTSHNTKRNKIIGEYCQYLDIAIEQENNINTDIHNCKDKITCNIGQILQQIRNEKI